MKEKIKLALAQISSRRESKKENLQKIEEFTVKAKEQAADLVIFPELSLTGYVLHDQIYELAETIPGPSTKRIEDLAKKTGMHIIFGMPELSEKTKATIFNTAVFVGPKGFIGKYRKMYLPTHSVFEEKRYFRSGYQTATFNTPIGNIGLFICYDIFFPEVCRLTRLKGAELMVCISASSRTQRLLRNSHGSKGFGKHSLPRLCQLGRGGGWTAILGRKQTGKPNRRPDGESKVRRGGSRHLRS